MIRFPRISRSTLCSFAACALALPALGQTVFTGGGTGDWRDAANWDGVNNVKDNAGDYVIADGFASLAMTGSNLGGAGGVVTVQGSSSATFEGFKQLQNVTVNFQDSSQYLLAGSGAKFGTGVTVNYDSSAISDSTGIKYAVWREEAVINLNSGGLIVGELAFNEAGLINLNGGDLSAASITSSLIAGGIDFDSAAGSTFTLLGSTTATDLDSYITDGLFTIGGATEAVSALSFSKAITDSGLELTVAAVPEPSSFAILSGVLALGFFLRRRPSKCCGFSRRSVLRAAMARSAN